MKNGQCPKCGSIEVHSQDTRGYRGFLRISAFYTPQITSYICTGCGYLEEYVLDKNKLAFIAEKWPRVSRIR